MAYQMPVPSQEEAVGYLEKTVPHDGRLIRIGGHSKGGNLAIYAAAMCYDRLKRRIIAIYNNDGPGFLESMLEKKAYLEIKDKVRTIVPETSIIGMLLEHGDSYEVVKSTGKGIMQHDGLSWQVYRNGFVKLDERSKESLVIDKTISAWVMGLSDDERVAFVDAVYNASHVAVLVGALGRGDRELIAMALRDRLHQPYREKLIPEYNKVKTAAEQCGAIAFCISGAGPTLLALTDEASFAAQFAEKCKRLEHRWNIMELAVDTEGIVAE